MQLPQNESLMAVIQELVSYIIVFIPLSDLWLLFMMHVMLISLSRGLGAVFGPAVIAKVT